MSDTRPDDQDLLIMLAYGLKRRKADLAAAAKKHGTDEEAAIRVARAVLDHVRLCGYDLVRARAPAENVGWPPTGSAREAGLDKGPKKAG